jgi:large subunit ribosomal protein L29
MVLIRKKDMMTMETKVLEQKLFELRKELNTEKGLVASGGRSQNPGKIKEIRRTIARIKTILSQKERNLDNIKKDDIKERKKAPAPKTQGA